MLRVLITGDRDWSNWKTMISVLRTLPTQTTIVHGDCRGADKMAGRIAEVLGFAVEVYPADWDKHGRKAGILRNLRMLDTEPMLTLAFHNNIKASRGTKHCMTESIRRNIPTRLYTYSTDLDQVEEGN